MRGNFERAVRLKYGITFLVMAVLACAASALSAAWVTRALLLWVALALLIVAIAYLTNSPRLLFKKDNGTREWWSWLLLWPYYLLAWLSFWSHFLTNRRAASSEIAAGLWLSRRLSAREARSANIGWRAILDLACEFPRTPLEGCEYLSLPVLDGTAPTLEQMSIAVDYINRGRDRGPVLLHCALGHGRSATIAVAWLLNCGIAESVEDGIAQVRKVRPGVGLNAKQISQLNEFLAQNAQLGQMGK